MSGTAATAGRQRQGQGARSAKDPQEQQRQLHADLQTLKDRAGLTDAELADYAAHPEQAHQAAALGEDALPLKKFRGVAPGPKKVAVEKEPTEKKLAEHTWLKPKEVGHKDNNRHAEPDLARAREMRTEAAKLSERNRTGGGTAKPRKREKREQTASALRNQANRLEQSHKGKGAIAGNVKDYADAHPDKRSWLRKKADKGVKVMGSEEATEQAAFETGNCDDGISSRRVKEQTTTAASVGLAGLTAEASGKREYTWGEVREKGDGIAGSQFSGKTQFGQEKLEGSAEARLSLSSAVLQAKGSIEKSLVAIDQKWQWKFPLDFMGEKQNASIFLKITGMVGEEAKAQVDAEVRARPPKNGRFDPVALLQGEAFAGAKVKLGAGIAYEWIKLEPKAYKEKLDMCLTPQIRALAASSDEMMVIVNLAGGEALVGKLWSALFAKDEAGAKQLATLEAAGEGTAGLGIKGAAGFGFRNGQVELHWAAGVTAGVGVGSEVKVTFDALEGAKFGLVVLGPMIPVVRRWLAQGGAAMVFDQLWASVGDWLSGDTKARAEVAAGRHRSLPAAHRARLVQVLVANYLEEGDETAVLQIVRDAFNTNDVDQVLAGQDRKALRHRMTDKGQREWDMLFSFAKGPLSD